MPDASGRFNVLALWLLNIILSCGLLDSGHFPYLIFLISLYLSFLRKKKCHPSSYPCQVLPGTRKIILINWWTHWSWEWEFVGVPVLDVSSLKEIPRDINTYPEVRDPGTSLRPVEKTDNMESRGFSGLHKSVLWGFLMFGISLILKFVVLRMS